MEDSYDYDLFISYAEADRNWVMGYLVPELGIPKERLITPSSMAPDSVAVNEFARAVTSSRLTVLVLTPEYLQDRWAIFSEQLASYDNVERGTSRLIPLRLRYCEVPLQLRIFTGLDCYEETHWADCAAKLRQRLGQPEPLPEDIPCPYPGMTAFSEQNSDFFLGRGEAIERLLLCLRNQRYVFVVGPSGSGKSSLVMAGLLPRLHKHEARKWRTKTMRPGADPLTALAAELGCQSHTEAAYAEQVRILLGGSPEAERFLLVIDQFEEIFTSATQDNQRAFLNALKDLRSVPQCTLLMIVRSDFFYIDLVEMHRPPIIAEQRFELWPLQGEALETAIRGPAEEVNVYLESVLLERLKHDAGEEPGVLPFLQETMVLLWANRQRHLLTLQAYKQLGGQEGSGLTTALTAKANGVVAEELSTDQYAIARRIFVRLVQFVIGRRPARRQLPVSELRAAQDDPALFDETLEVLTRNRLLTLSGLQSGDARKVDLPHEALIEGWVSLKEWLAQYHEPEQTRRRLEDDATVWLNHRRSRSWLLDEGKLAEAESYLSSAAARDLGYTVTLEQLVAESKKGLMRQRRQRLVARVSVLGMVVAILAAGITFLVLQGFIYLAKVNRARALGAGAVIQMQTGDPQVGLQMAMEAVSITNDLGEPSPAQPETALHLALTTAMPGRGLELREHTKAVRQGVYSPDARRIATAGYDTLAIVWDAHTGRVIHRLDAGDNAVTSVAFSPDSKRLVTAATDGRVKIWDMLDGRLLLTMRGHRGAVWSAAFSPDPEGNFIVTAGNDKTMRVWNSITGDEVFTRTNENDRVFRSAAYNPDGTVIVTAADDAVVKLWDTKGISFGNLTGHTDAVLKASFSADGLWIVSASEDGTARVWDISTLQEVLTLGGHTGEVTSAVFSPDGRRILTTGVDGTGRLWDISSGVLLATMPVQPGGLWSGAFTPDGRNIITAGEDGRAQVWEPSPGEELPTLWGHPDGLWRSTYSPDNRRIVTVGAAGAARVWDSSTGQLALTLIGHSGIVYSASFRPPDGKQIATASRDATVSIWDAVTGGLQYTVPHSSAVFSAMYSPDGRHLATAAADGTVRILDSDTGQVLRTLKGQAGVVHSAAYTPDGRRIVTAGSDGAVRIWETASGNELRSRHLGTIPVIAASYSPDGERLVIARFTTAEVWDANMDRHYFSLVGHLSWINSVQFSPDGRFIVTSSGDRTARVWYADTGRQRATLSGHMDGVNGATYSPDGLRIVTSSDDRTARQYYTRREDQLALAQSRIRRPLTPQEIDTYLSDPVSP